jgi:hypothetical protein
MPGSSAGQKKAPICTGTWAAQTTAISLAGDRANAAVLTAMIDAFQWSYFAPVSYFYNARNTIDSTCAR